MRAEVETLGPLAPAVASAPAWETSEVFRLYAQRVVRWAVFLGDHEDDLDDTVQEVFTVVHEKLPTFRGNAKISTWLYQITENVVRRHRRHNRLRRLLGRSSTLAERLPSRIPLPLRQLELREANAQVQNLLAGLSERYRTVLLLFEVEGLTGEQIAELKGVRVSVVWVWLSRARAHLLKQLRKSNRSFPESLKNWLEE